MKKTLFCAHCQTETVQVFRVHGEGQGSELIATCGCGREIKFPAYSTVKELRAAFAAHKVANSGQVVIDESKPKEEHPALKALADA